MSSQNVSTTAVYMAYNTSTGAYQTGDVSNHTIKLVKDGTEAAPTNNPVEVDSTNAKGAYKLTLTAAETQFGTVWVGGVSSTANVIIVPITLTFEILPTALDANNFVKADVEDWKGNAVAAAASGIPDVNVKNMNNVSASSITTINAMQGTTAAVQFTSNLVQVDVRDIVGVAAVLDANNLLKVDVEDINGNATAAQNVSKANQAICRGTCSNGSITSVPTSSFTPGNGGNVSGQFIGRTIVFDINTATVSLQGQATNITASTTGATPTFTVGTLTTAPASGDTFGIY